MAQLARNNSDSMLRNTNSNFTSDEWVDELKKILNILGSTRSGNPRGRPKKMMERTWRVD